MSKVYVSELDTSTGLYKTLTVGNAPLRLNLPTGESLDIGLAKNPDGTMAFYLSTKQGTLAIDPVVANAIRVYTKESAF